jgi:hypothetical protein
MAKRLPEKPTHSVLVALGAAGLLTAAAVTSCTWYIPFGPHDVVGCEAYDYSAEPTNGSSLLAVYDPGGQNLIFQFTPPPFRVDLETHEAIQSGSGSGSGSVTEAQVRLLVADATREACRREITDNVALFDPLVDDHNCDVDYDDAMITLVFTPAPVGEPEIPGPPIQVDPETCVAPCVAENCSEATGGFDGYDSPPEHPFARSVRCQCQVAEMGDCGGGTLPNLTFVPDGGAFTESYCVPDGVPPADYCRYQVSSYFEATIRAISHWGSVTTDDEGWAHTCAEGPLGNHTPANLPVEGKPPTDRPRPRGA